METNKGSNIMLVKVNKFFCRRQSMVAAFCHTEN